MKKYLDWRDSDILANLHFKKVEAKHMFEISQIQQNGPNWKEMLAQQTEGGGEGGGMEGLGGGSSGGGGMPPDFSGGPAAIGGGEEADLGGEAPPADVPEAPPAEV
jgi:hypothetical protein